MVRGRRLAAIAAGLIALWLAALLIGGVAAAGYVGGRITGRLRESLRADVTVGDVALGLVRGQVELADLDVRKAGLGTLTLDIDRVRCDLPPLGAALWSRECRDLAVEGVRLEASAATVFQLERRARRPLHVRHVSIRNATLVFAPSAFLPDLGRVEILVDHVEAGPTTFKTPLSWVFAMRALRARIALPAGVVLGLTYERGVLTATGSILGSAPIAIPVALPVAEAADDARAEIGKLVSLGRSLAEELLARRAKDWLRSKLGG